MRWWFPRRWAMSRRRLISRASRASPCCRAAAAHRNGLLELDVEGRRCLVEPGIVLDELNRQLRPHGLWFPVDVSTSSRATIGGMAGNNSCGGRSIRYGMMRDNVTAIDAILSDGSTARFGDVASTSPSGLLKELQPRLLAMGETHGADILDGFPKVLRRVGGYNVDALIPDAMAMRPGGAAGDGINLSHLLVGSEGTLAYSTAIELKLWPLPAKKIMGICHFPTFYKAMDAAQHLVTLDPVAVEEEDMVENERRLRQLHEMMGDLGFGWDKGAAWRGGVVDAIDPGMQGRIAEWRKSGLNIMMSEKSEAKPVSFLEDCAVELKDLAEYTDKLTAIFDRNGVKGTWYAHASVGCLHVRPVLNMKQAGGAETMRAIAEEAFELVRSFGGSHSGEHGDGIVRSEFNDRMFGPVLPDLFRQVKAMFDPQGMFNPGKITDAPKMDDRELFRFAPGYEAEDFNSVLDWAAWPGAAGGFQGAVEMCNNNGACRKLTGGVMCPSYRATRNERDAVRGRANSLRLAMSGQLGPGAMASDAMAETMKLCVSCKACKRECPVGVDMARMKVEVTAARAAKHGIPLHDRLIGNLPAYAPLASGLSGLSNLSNAFRNGEIGSAPTGAGTPAVLFADTFNRYFEPENLRAAIRVLRAAGYDVFAPTPAAGRPYCCGRTYLSAGMVDKARAEAERLVTALYPLARSGVRIVGLEPSCTLALRDEVPALLGTAQAEAVAEATLTFAELIEADRPDLPVPAAAARRPVKLHGHCHQKAFDLVKPAEAVLRDIAGAEVEVIETSCCGMAGAFGYGRDTYDVSIRMAEASLLPAVRAAPNDAAIVADGTSCRCQIDDGTGREVVHLARHLDRLISGS